MFYGGVREGAGTQSPTKSGGSGDLPNQTVGSVPTDTMVKKVCHFRRRHRSFLFRKRGRIGLIYWIILFSILQAGVGYGAKWLLT